MSINVQTPTDTTLVMSRTFDAPRDVVFACHTQPEHLRHWWGRGNPLDVDIDFQVGGKWRFVETADGTQHAFRGEIKAIDAPNSFTWTFEYEPMAGHILTEQYVFTEENGRTTVTSSSTFDSKADRDGMIESGMEDGAEQSYAALDAYLLKLS
ncbi:SRPBCC family protein [Actinoplanes sp. TRM 88003]|uniref:SRPBCC family protein n=1 Tax=Paractinoplanes aksuensis TaxID=2939490 RepID=A0ABT1DMY7_9ACTN|nr:SRPBCC domain-containing protein [Actinoplanes aksuensis]MCO8271446.1 SRPBCC family protein [Actinoplanes aksuensis]